MCMHTSLGISMFKYTQLQDILVRVVKNASIPGFLSAYSGCTFDTTGMFNDSVCILLLRCSSTGWLEHWYILSVLY